MVDDNESDLLITRRALTGKRYKVITAKSGAEALDTFSRKKSDISLVVLDIFLSDSDGRRLAQKMKADAPDMPVILFSNYGYKDKLKKWGLEDVDHVMKHDEKKLLSLAEKYRKKSLKHQEA